MSATAATYQFSGSRTESEARDQIRVIRSYGETMARPESVRYRSVQSRATTRTEAQKSNCRVLRRLKGFLVEMQGANARVAFVENDRTIPYDLPAEQLRRAGINVRNQPFQMDEIEMEAAGGGRILGYHFLPLAKPADAYIEPLNFDAERRRKRDLILKELGKTQG